MPTSRGEKREKNAKVSDSVGEEAGERWGEDEKDLQVIVIIMEIIMIIMGIMIMIRITLIRIMIHTGMTALMMAVSWMEMPKDFMWRLRKG